MASASLPIIIFLVLAVGVVLVYILLQRLQSDLEAMEQRSRRSASEIERMQRELGQTLMETQKLPSKVKATKEFIASEARKSASKLVPRRPPPRASAKKEDR